MVELKARILKLEEENSKFKNKIFKLEKLLKENNIEINLSEEDESDFVIEIKSARQFNLGNLKNLNTHNRHVTIRESNEEDSSNPPSRAPTDPNESLNVDNHKRLSLFSSDKLLINNKESSVLLNKHKKFNSSFNLDMHNLNGRDEQNDHHHSLLSVSEEEKPDNQIVYLNTENLSPHPTLSPKKQNSSEIQNYQFQLCELENEKEELEEKNKEFESKLFEKTKTLKERDLQIIKKDKQIIDHEKTLS